MSHIIDKIRNGEYGAKTALPDRPSKPRLVNADDPEAIREHADAMEAYNVLKAEYDAAWEQRRSEEREGTERFKQDALEEVGLAGHEAAERAYSKAWSDGHSSGLQDVYHELDELADVIGV